MPHQSIPGEFLPSKWQKKIEAPTTMVIAIV
jgi:hypothetical protein